MSNDKKLSCVCGKLYSSAPSLCVHRKKCSMFLEHKLSKQDIINHDSSLSPLELRVMELENQIKLKDDEIQSLKNEIQTLKNPTQDIQNVVLEIKPIDNNTVIEKFDVKKSKIKVKSLSTVERIDNILYIHTDGANSISNSQSKIPAFSKSALNFKEFLDEIHIDLDKFEKISNTNCVTCFTEIIEEYLEIVGVENRPFHYDKPNKILYVKDSMNEWVIDKNNGILRVFVLRLSKKYMSFINEYRSKYINVDNSQHPQNSNYSFIIQELNSLSDEDAVNLNKIMKSIRSNIHL